MNEASVANAVSAAVKVQVAEELIVDNCRRQFGEQLARLAQQVCAGTGFGRCWCWCCEHILAARVLLSRYALGRVLGGRQRCEGVLAARACAAQQVCTGHGCWDCALWVTALGGRPGSWCVFYSAGGCGEKWLGAVTSG